MKLSKLVVEFYVIILLVAHSYANVYYVSPSGKDANNGLSVDSAWQTISKVNSISFLAGDQILFKGGNSFAGELTFGIDDGGTATHPIIVNSYGVGRAQITSTSQNGITIHDTGGFTIKRLNFIGNDAASYRGIYVNTDVGGSRKLKHIYIDSCNFKKYGEGIRIAGTNSGFDDIRITNCIADSNTNTGIVVSGAHNDLYIGDCIAYDNRGSQNNTGSGILISGITDGIIEYCEVYNNGYTNTGTSGGPEGIWAYGVDSLVIQYCISHNNSTGPNNFDGGGFDIDGGSSNCIMQYNYAYENEGQGFFMGHFSGAPKKANNTIRYNISENNGLRHSYGGIGFWNQSGNLDSGCKVYNNVVYTSMSKVISGNPSCISFENGAGGTMDNVSFYNNILIAADGLNLVDVRSQTSEFTFGNNLYWSTGSFNLRWGIATYNSLSAWRAATGQEKLGGSDVGIQADPKLRNPGNGQKLINPHQLAGLTAYMQQIGSPCKDSGLNLDSLFGLNPGSNDFYGTAIPQNMQYDIGAYEATEISALGEPPNPGTSGTLQITVSPNPFHTASFITLVVPKEQRVKLDVLNALGKQVKCLFHGIYSRGIYHQVWDGRDSSGNIVLNGIYLFRLFSAKETRTIKVVLQR